MRWKITRESEKILNCGQGNTIRMMQFPTRTYRCGYNLVLMCSYDGLDRGTVTTVLVKYSNGLYLRRIIQRINCKPPPPPLHITLCFFLCFCVLVCYNTGPVFFFFTRLCVLPERPPGTMRNAFVFPRLRCISLYFPYLGFVIFWSRSTHPATVIAHTSGMYINFQVDLPLTAVDANRIYFSLLWWQKDCNHITVIQPIFLSLIKSSHRRRAFHDHKPSRYHCQHHRHGKNTISLTINTLPQTTTTT